MTTNHIRSMLLQGFKSRLIRYPRLSYGRTNRSAQQLYTSQMYGLNVQLPAGLYLNFKVDFQKSCLHNEAYKFCEAQRSYFRQAQYNSYPLHVKHFFYLKSKKIIFVSKHNIEIFDLTAIMEIVFFLYSSDYLNLIQMWVFKGGLINSEHFPTLRKEVRPWLISFSKLKN
jgi:hypothetical protein